jgi:hypothetical protein
MSASWWNGRQITAKRQNLQQKNEVGNKDTGLGNEKKPYAILNNLLS